MSLAWKGGSTRAHRAWRRRVLERDQYVCQVQLRCRGDRATHADHVIPKSVRPDLALDVDNGRASCGPCNTSRGAGEFTPAGVPPQRTWSW